MLIRAVAQLPGAHLVLVGDGDERTALERLAADLGISDRVAMTGWTDAAPARLHSFDVVAIPSRFEGLPLVLLEAMLSGRAIVATGVGQHSRRTAGRQDGTAWSRSTTPTRSPSPCNG